MWRTQLAVLFVVRPIICHITAPDAEAVLDFLDSLPLTNITPSCRDGIAKVRSHIWSEDAVPKEKEFFATSSGIGRSNEFSTVELDRWIYRAYECLQSAGERAFSKSSHPTAYCFAREKAHQHSNATFMELWHSVDKPKKGTLQVVSCVRSRHQSPWYQRVWPATEFLLHCVFVMLVVIATLCDIRSDMLRRSPGLEMIIAFSAIKNIRKLVEMPGTAQSTVTCMFGFRFLSMVWTLVGHSFAFVQVFIENVEQYKEDMVNGFFNQWITNFTLSVDIFFVLSGSLTAYIWFAKTRSSPSVFQPSWTSWAYWLRFYRHRLIRLWPAYIYSIVDAGMRASVQHYHAAWPPVDPAIQCPKYWWHNILFINSIYSNRYIGTEFIFYFVSPVFLLTLRNSLRGGLLLAFATIFTSSLLNAIAMVIWNFPPTQFFWKQPQIFSADFVQHHIMMYIKPWYRIGPYVIGILLGYHLASIQSSNVKMSLTKCHQLAGWVFACVAAFCIIFGLYPALQGWNWPVYHVLYGATHRIIFACAIAWVIYACHTGYGGFINYVLSMKLLLPLSTLCYSVLVYGFGAAVYLVHVIFVVFTFLLAPFPITYTSKWPIFGHCIVQLLLSYFFGTLCALIAELPALNLECIIFRESKKKT
uniref:Acyl_transf_3 domain-containing protein n=1 Tax=Ascaris lumbricoides TaxID=6252 RepID=A0A0M3I004_ASCLU